jgi:hypothetical protein
MTSPLEDSVDLSDDEGNLDERHARRGEPR